MKNIYRIILFSAIIFVILTLFFATNESQSDGYDAYGFPFSFYISFGGKCDPCPGTRYTWYNLLIDILLVVVPVSVIIKLIKFLRPGDPGKKFHNK